MPVRFHWYSTNPEGFFSIWPLRALRRPFHLWRGSGRGGHTPKTSSQQYCKVNHRKWL